MAKVTTCKVVFPPSYPIIAKFMRLDANITVKEALKVIAESNYVSTVNCALYVPKQKVQFEETRLLADYAELIKENDNSVEVKLLARPRSKHCITFHGECLIL